MKACFASKSQLKSVSDTTLLNHVSMKNYDKFANYYDQMGADEHSVRMVEYSCKLFGKFKLRPKTALDLCCGTGTAISLFADNGIAMSGLDGSAQMLAIASKKLKGRSVKLFQKTLPRFRLIDPGDSQKNLKFDLVTSFYDSLNYLLSANDLKIAFRSVQKHLKPSGYFIFDMNTEHALSTIWGTNIYSGIRDNFAWIWTNEYDRRKKVATCRPSFFVQEGKQWKRFDEFHLEKAYSNKMVALLLKETGFSVRGLYDCFSLEKPKKHSIRICVVAQII